jgi:hypothetical protein
MTPEKGIPASLRLFLLLIILGLSITLVYVSLRIDSRLDTVEHSLLLEPATPSNTDIEATDTNSPAFTVRKTVYIPAYSHVYHQDGKPHLLTVTLSVRNTDFEHPITVSTVKYYDTNGKELVSQLKQPIKLGPLATREFVVPREDQLGGSGANFIVEWMAKTDVSEPIIESVMIDTSGQQGISFARSGMVVRDSSK